MNERETLEYGKTLWAKGEWDNEPDQLEWTHEGMPCRIVRIFSGNLCGYVAIPSDHPLHGKDYSYIEGNTDIRVHGGITYSNDGIYNVYYKQPDDEPKNVWWLGFDCSHGFDISPMFEKMFVEKGFSSQKQREENNKLFGYTYKNMGWVKNEVERLADQLKAVA